MDRTLTNPTYCKFVLSIRIKPGKKEKYFIYTLRTKVFPLPHPKKSKPEGTETPAKTTIQKRDIQALFLIGCTKSTEEFPLSLLGEIYCITDKNLTKAELKTWGFIKILDYFELKHLAAAPCPLT